jgi:hypothetical protein
VSEAVELAFLCQLNILCPKHQAVLHQDNIVDPQSQHHFRSGITLSLLDHASSRKVPLVIVLEADSGVLECI